MDLACVRAASVLFWAGVGRGGRFPLVRGDLSDPISVGNIGTLAAFVGGQCFVPIFVFDLVHRGIYVGLHFCMVAFCFQLGVRAPLPLGRCPPDGPGGGQLRLPDGRAETEE